MRVEEAIALIDNRIVEMTKVAEEARTALEALESVEKDREMMVPLGGGVFVRVEFSGKVFMDVGGGIVLEKNVEAVKERLKKRIARAEDEIKRLKEERAKIIEEVKGRLESAK